MCLLVQGNPQEKLPGWEPRLVEASPEDVQSQISPAKGGRRQKGHKENKIENYKDEITNKNSVTLVERFFRLRLPR